MCLFRTLFIKHHWIWKVSGTSRWRNLVFPACRFLKLEHHLHSPYGESIIERMMQYIKDRTESFDDYFPCRVKDCKLKHIINWLNLSVDYHNNNKKSVKWTEPNDRFNLCYFWIFWLFRIRYTLQYIIIKNLFCYEKIN